jgi:hypothetical protein
MSVGGVMGAFLVARVWFLRYIVLIQLTKKKMFNKKQIVIISGAR